MDVYLTFVNLIASLKPDFGHHNRRNACLPFDFIVYVNNES